MSKALAVLGCALVCDNATAQAQITGAPSVKVMADSKGVYTSPLTVMVMGATQGSFAQTAPMTATIVSTAMKVMIDNMPPILEGDKTQAPAMCVCVDPSTGATMTVPVNVTVQSAGQVKVKGS